MRFTCTYGLEQHGSGGDRPPLPDALSSLLPACRGVLREARGRRGVICGARGVLAVPRTSLCAGRDVDEEELRTRLRVALEADAAGGVGTHRHERRLHTTDACVHGGEVQGVLDRAQ